MSNENVRRYDLINSFAQRDEEAEQKYKGYKSKDPFPGISPTLLNSADIMDYVAATGMIFPFYPELDSDDRDVRHWKTASYEIRLLGKCVYWNEKGEKKVEEIGEGQEFILRRNSIAFVTLEPRFRIPDYIALRFNLKITHIYRGILLGTGPLVDPGFDGKISIPLHNLTTNDYIFKGGEGLIWMEFTKLSDSNTWDKEDKAIQRIGKLRLFPVAKCFSDVEDFLSKAYPGPIRSSIPAAIFQAEKTAADAERAINDAKDKTNKAIEEAHEIVRKFRNYAIWGAIGAVLTLLLTLIGLGWQVESIINDTNSYLNSAQKEFNLLKSNEMKAIEELKLKTDQLNENLTRIQAVAREKKETRKQDKKAAPLYDKKQQ